MSERDLKDGLKAAGYSFEEMWFYRQNQDLLEELREKRTDQENKTRDRSHLRLIPGGRQESDTTPSEVTGAPPVKKVA